MNQASVFFDGVCNFSNGFVNFMIPRDKKNYFRYSPLQSDFAKKFLEEHNLPTHKLITFYLYENGKIYSRSTAALRLFRKLSGLYPLLYLFIIVPRPVRDFFYHIISKNRYKWFGEKDHCMVPTKE